VQCHGSRCEFDICMHGKNCHAKLREISWDAFETRVRGTALVA
jgi:hypothetical protein